MLKFSIIAPIADNHVDYKTVNEVQEMVAQLKNRVAEYLLVIAKVTKHTENSLTKTSNDIMDELKELKEYVRENVPPLVLLMSTFITKRCFTLITHRLQAIKDQNLILTTLLPEANKKTINECVTAFQDSIARFQVIYLKVIEEDTELSESLVFRRYVVFTLPRIYLESRHSWKISMESRWQWCRR